MNQDKQYKLTMPLELHTQIKTVAALNRRSMSSQVILMLERALASSEAVEGEGLATNTPSAAN